MSRQFGEASYGGNFKKNEYRKLKDGVNVYRILPPIGELAKDGKWSIFYSVHYGYKNSKGHMIPFQSPLIKNRKSGMIEAPDAALERINALKAQYDTAKKSGNTELLIKLEPLIGKKAQFNLDNNHHVNALDEQGNVVILKLRHRAKLVLDEKIKQLRAAGIDPLSVTNGRVFSITRSGNALDTSFQVDVLKKKIIVEGVGEVEQAVVSTLSKETVDKCLKEAADLDKLYKRVTSEEVARIVKEGVRAVDEILDTTGTSAPAAADDTGHDEPQSESASQAQSKDQQVADAAAIAAAGGTLQSQQNVGTGSNTGAAMSTSGGTDVTTAPSLMAQPKTETPPVTAQAKALSDMNTDEFLASLNLGN